MNEKEYKTKSGNYSAKYFCSKCNKPHIKTSNLGRKHLVYNSYKQ